MYILDCLDLDMKSVNNAFEDVLSWMKELNMKAEGDELADSLLGIMRENNPFDLIVANSFCATPTDKMILLIYEEARKRILKKYPSAEITWRVYGSQSRFDIDDATYTIAYKARREEE